LVFVSTSNREGFPNTFLHAWSRGVPTVSFIDSGAREGGVPIERIVHSIEEMTVTVDLLLKNEADRCKIGEECKRYVESHHSRDVVLDMYDDLFAGLLLNKGETAGGPLKV